MYRGRFAPSPTGPLHFGSLVAAVASYLEAKIHHGEWLLRIEDLDQPRTMPGAAESILRTLEAWGFEWDGPVVYQSRRQDLYAAALSGLQESGLVYACGCTRKEIADSAIHGIEGAIYPGTCRNGLPSGKSARAWRVRTENRIIGFDDAIQGYIAQNLELDIGDFVLKRADGLYAYQLAVVVDDAEQGITDIVRGADLLDSTPRQIYLQSLMGFPAIRYAHIPIVTNQQGEKLSKQTLAKTLDDRYPQTQLWLALDYLGQSPPAELMNASIGTLWQWMLTHWKLENIPHIRHAKIQPEPSLS
ncbi:glutamyl-Q tRNA(Asp) synthetase [Methylophilaceae bacterium]|nr:glutamyl-Q tRNA(Asp) synthetase [Methylophilaceae bacterium]